MALASRRCSNDSGSVTSPRAQLHPEDDQDRDVGTVAGQTGCADRRGDGTAAASGRQSRPVPATPPETMASSCSAGALMNALVHPVRRQLAEQVPEEQEKDADVEQVAAPAQRAGAKHLRRVALPCVLVAIEARQAAHEEHRQTDVRIDGEKEIVQIGQERGSWGRSRMARCALIPSLGRMTWIGCAWPGLAWPLAEQPSNTGGSAQLSSSGLVGGRLDRLRLFSGELDQCAHHAGVGAVALAQGAKKRVQDVGDFAEECACLARRLGGRELQHCRQIVGKFPWGEERGRPFRRFVQRSIIAGPRSRESPWTCSNRCSEVARPRSNSST